MVRTLKSVKKLPAVVLVLLCTFLFNKTYATHYAAVDISVQYAGTGPNDLKYKVTLDVYFACEVGSSSPSTSETIHYFSASEGGSTNTPYTGNRTQSMPQVCVNDVGLEEIAHQLCDAGQNSCSSPGSPYPGYKHHRYETILTLTSQQTDWIFWWESGQRNLKIQNITLDPNQQGQEGDIFVEAGLDNLFRYDNATPKFMVQPLPYLCVNQPVTYLNGPLDPFGDSLEVLNVIPRQNYNTQYSYYQVQSQSYYTAANPIASAAGNPYKVDQTTGTATFTPTVTGPHVLAFRCNAYDRGSAGSACKGGGSTSTGRLVAFIHRDVQVAVLPCSGLPPDISELQNVQNGVLDATSGKYTLCTGNAFEFDVTATTTLSNRKLYLEANTATIPGSSLSSSGGGGATATEHFKWTPHYGTIGEHILIITAKDSTCDPTSPVVLKSYKVVRLEVIPSIDAGVDKAICLEGGRPVQLFVKGAESCIKWSDIGGGPAIGLSNGNDTLQNPKVDSPYKEATYVVTAFAVPSICKNKDTVSLYKDTSNNIVIFPDNPIILCKPDYLQLEATPVGRPPVDTLICGASADTSKLIDSLYINGSLAGSFDTLGPLTPTFPNDVTGARQQFLIRKADLLESGLLYSAIKGIAFEAKSPDPAYQYSNFKIYMKCTSEDKISAIKGFQSGLTLVYSASGPVTIQEGVNKFVLSQPYNWNIFQNLLVEIVYSGNAATNPSGLNPIVKFVPTDYISTISLTSAPNTLCTATNITENYARPQFQFFYTEPRKPFKVTWTTPTFLSDSTIQQPLAFIPKSTMHIVKTMGRNSCIVRDTADIYVPEHHYSVTPADTAICYGESAPLHVRGGGFTYKWYKLDDKGNYQLLYSPTGKETTCYDCADPLLTPQQTTTYKIAVYDSVWCIDTLTARVVVLPLPDIRILNRDTVVKYGQSIQLLASGAKLYNWMPVGTLNNANISYPVATPTEPTTYIAGGIGSNGCRAFDTVKVGIDYRDNLFIPSAFSPNGDGKNDVFKINNLTFQRIVEFRVFNRWGQEVFMANDNTGWDGNWKGEPQDMGTYTYQIRVGFPDGYVESYKGGVTLIR